MISGIGVDICKVSRIKNALETQHFKTRIYSSEEIAYCEAKGAKKFESYAAGFAAREAFCKASETNLILTMNAKNFSLLRVDGKPKIKLSGELAAFKDKVFVSISHEDDYACAMVVIEKFIER